MNYDQYLDAVRRESDRTAVVSRSAHDTPIPFLGDWTVRDLIAHLGMVYAFGAANAAAGSVERAAPGPEAAAPDGDGLADWFEERRAALVDTLAAADPDGPAWTFGGAGTNRFWVRRMALETLVHRWDVEAAVDQVTAMDSDLASDGVQEYTEVALRHSMSRPDRVYPSETLHLHRTDGPGEWMFATGEDGQPVITQEHGKGDAAVRGPAAQLLLWVWGRPTEDLEYFGDRAVADAWQALAP